MNKLHLRPLSTREKLFAVVVLVSGLCFLSGFLLTNFREDDPWFAQHVVHYTPWGWVAFRWGTWSGRVLPELLLWVFAPRNMLYWVAVSLGTYLCQVFLLFKYYRLFQPTNKLKLDTIILALICNFLWILDGTVVDNSIFWLTGSINYFWMGVLFLAAIYTPLHIVVKKKLPSKGFVIWSLLSGIAVALSHEQFGLSLVGASVILLTATLVRKKFNSKLTLGLGSIKYIAITPPLYVSVYAFAMTAPGNKARMVAETAKWLPDMRTIPIHSRIESDIRWFMDGIINHSGLMLVLIMFILAVALFLQKKRLQSACMAVGGSIIFASKTVKSGLAIGDAFIRSHLDKLVDFHTSWNFSGSLRSWIIVLFWITVLIMVIIGTISVLQGKINKIIVTVLYVIAAATIAALWFSPTMYASGSRVFYAANVLLFMASIILLIDAVGVGKYRILER